MGITEGLTRIVVFAVNFAFVLVGGALLILGILNKVNITKFNEVIPPEYHAIGYITNIAIAVGCIIFITAFLGCCGTVQSNTCMLKTYAGILLVTVIAQVALGAYAMIEMNNKHDLQLKVNDIMDNLFENYVEHHNEVDFIQKFLICCGTTGPAFWISTNKPVPKSCFSDEKISTKGCSGNVADFLEGSVKHIGIAVAVFTVLEVIELFLALDLANCINARARIGR